MTPTPMKATTAFREMLSSAEPIVAPGAYNTLSAMLIERLGFRAVSFGGFACAAGMGTAEPMITLTEQASVCAAAGKHLRIPMITDAHAGFGDPVHVVRCVREFEAAGLACIHIEDAVYPKRMHYFKGFKHQIDKAQMVDKIQAAIEARTDPDFVIIARCESIGFGEHSSVKDGIDRMEAYIEAGADGLMPMVFDPSLIPIVRSAFPDSIPFYWAGGLGDVFGRGDPSVSELVDLGYKIIVYPMLAVTGATTAVLDAFTPLIESGRADYDHSAHSEAYFTIQDALGLPELYAIEAQTTESEGQGIPDRFMPATPDTGI